MSSAACYFSLSLQRCRAGTGGSYLMRQHVFRDGGGKDASSNRQRVLVKIEAGRTVGVIEAVFVVRSTDEHIGAGRFLHEYLHVFGSEPSGIIAQMYGATIDGAAERFA